MHNLISLSLLIEPFRVIWDLDDSPQKEFVTLKNILIFKKRRRAERDGCAVEATYSLRPLQEWDLGFESYSEHKCVPAFFCVCVAYVGPGLAVGRSPILGAINCLCHSYFHPSSCYYLSLSYASKWTLHAKFCMHYCLNFLAHHTLSYVTIKTLIITRDSQ
jgi:hypothetical protein